MVVTAVVLAAACRLVSGRGPAACPPLLRRYIFDSKRQPQTQLVTCMHPRIPQRALVLDTICSAPVA